MHTLVHFCMHMCICVCIPQNSRKKGKWWGPLRKRFSGKMQSLHSPFSGLPAPTLLLKSHVLMCYLALPHIFHSALGSTQWAWILIRQFLVTSFLSTVFIFFWFWWVNKAANYASCNINDRVKRNQPRKTCCYRKMVGFFLKSLVSTSWVTNFQGQWWKVTKNGTNTNIAKNSKNEKAYLERLFGQSQCPDSVWKLIDPNSNHKHLNIGLSSRHFRLPFHPFPRHINNEENHLEVTIAANNPSFSRHKYLTNGKIQRDIEDDMLAATVTSLAPLLGSHRCKKKQGVSCVHFDNMFPG